MDINLIAAMSENRVIGRNGQIPWKIPGEQAYFKKVTSDHIVVMGKHTWDSLNHKPLPKRTNVLLSTSISQDEYPADDLIVLATPKAIFERFPHEKIFIIGGAQLYETFLPWANRIYLTVLHQTVSGDTYFPELEKSIWRVRKTCTGTGPIPHTFYVYQKSAPVI